MQTDTLLQWVQLSFVTALQLALPLLVVAFLVGAAMSCLQTVFQVHDSVLSLVPRVVAVVLTVGVTLPWMTDIMTGLFRQMLMSFPTTFGG